MVTILGFDLSEVCARLFLTCVATWFAWKFIQLCEHTEAIKDSLEQLTKPPPVPELCDAPVFSMAN